MSVSPELKRQIRRYEPCLPRLPKEPPTGPGWIHEIKHDGFRILAELNAGGVKLITRKGFDLAQRFQLAAAAIAALPARALSTARPSPAMPTVYPCSTCSATAARTTP